MLTLTNSFCVALFCLTCGISISFFLFAEDNLITPFLYQKLLKTCDENLNWECFFGSTSNFFFGVFTFQSILNIRWDVKSGIIICARILLSSINHHHIWIKHQLCLSVNQLSIIHLSSTKIYLLHRQPTERMYTHKKYTWNSPPRFFSLSINQKQDQDPKVKSKIHSQTGSFGIVEIFLSIFQIANIEISRRFVGKTCNITSVQRIFPAKFQSSLPKGIYHSTANEPYPQKSVYTIDSYPSSLYYQRVFSIDSYVWYRAKLISMMSTFQNKKKTPTKIDSIAYTCVYCCDKMNSLRKL